VGSSLFLPRLKTRGLWIISANVYYALQLNTILAESKIETVASPALWLDDDDVDEVVRKLMEPVVNEMDCYTRAK
jgi:hypothetical protein